MLKTLLILFILSASVWAEDLKFTKRFYENIQYGDHERQVFDLWLPHSKQKTPLVIFIHGGGFVQGDKTGIRKNFWLMQKYLRSKIAFASINYRFLKHTPLQKIMREDIAGFVQYIRHHAQKYNIDKALIMSHGYSAGGSSSLWLATHDDLKNLKSKNKLRHQSSRIFAAAHMNAQVSYDFIDWFKYFGRDTVYHFIGDQVFSRYHLQSEEELYTERGQKIRKDLDMLENMDKNDAPVYFWNNYQNIPSTTNDQFMHGPIHAKLLYHQAQSVGLESYLGLVSENTASENGLGEVFDFFQKQLKKRKNR